ncbi:unnamed protein product, partial [Pocillopora meandrina]
MNAFLAAYWLAKVTDIAVIELLITFTHFFNSKTGKVETHFLFVEDILKDSTSANAETIFNILIRKLDHYGLQLQKLSSMASDGTAVMVGEQSGVAAYLKEVNNRMITFHCFDINYIKNVELWLRQLSKMFENSPKWMALYLKVQLEIKSVNLWLSFHAATSDIFIDYLAVQQTLRQLKDEDAVASGLLSKVNTAKFIRVIYILNAVLPILSCLSKTFQKGTNNEWTSGITTHNDFGLDK